MKIMCLHFWYSTPQVNPKSPRYFVVFADMFEMLDFGIWVRFAMSFCFLIVLFSSAQCALGVQFRLAGSRHVRVRSAGSELARWPRQHLADQALGVRML